MNLGDVVNGYEIVADLTAAEISPIVTYKVEKEGIPYVMKEIALRRLLRMLESLIRVR